MVKFCNKCNSPIEDGGYFCTECGSSDVREEKEEKEEKEEIIEPKELKEQEAEKEETTIPEVETDTVRSFGDKSIEQLQNAEIKSIQEDKIEEPVVEEPKASPSFADASFLNQPQDINIPSDLKLQEEGEQIQQTTQPVQTNFERIPRPPRKKKLGKIIKIILIVVGIIAFILLTLFVYHYVDNKSNANSGSGGTGEIVDFSTIFTAENSYRVGSATTGYISIPKSWANVTQPQGSTAHQYTDGTTWVVTLMSVPTSQYSAVTYANNVYESIKKNGGQNVQTGKTKIAGYTALTITASYPELNKYLTTWCFESSLGQTHYLAIEGPAPNGDNYNIIYSFKEDK